MEHLPFAIPVYLVAVLFVHLLNKREFARSPEKGERYKALPFLYKFSCWGIVLPTLVAAIFFHQALFILGVVLYMLLELACVRWYQKKGLW